MGSLVTVVADPTRRGAVLDDCVALIEAEVADKGGLTGLAVKGAYKSVKSLKPGMVRASMDALLNDFSKQLDPFWQDCQKAGAAPRTFFVQRKTEVANALLSITDQRANNSKHRVLVKAYKSLRGRAIDHIGSAMPRFADLVAKHAG